jgi:hypothetical protein
MGVILNVTEGGVKGSAIPSVPIGREAPLSQNKERMGPLSGGPALEAWMDCQIEKLDEGSALDNEVGITRMVFAAGV